MNKFLRWVGFVAVTGLTWFSFGGRSYYSSSRVIEYLLGRDPSSTDPESLLEVWGPPIVTVATVLNVATSRTYHIFRQFFPVEKSDTGEEKTAETSPPLKEIVIQNDPPANDKTTLSQPLPTETTPLLSSSPPTSFPMKMTFCLLRTVGIGNVMTAALFTYLGLENLFKNLGVEDENSQMAFSLSCLSAFLFQYGAYNISRILENVDALEKWSKTKNKKIHLKEALITSAVSLPSIAGVPFLSYYTFTQALTKIGAIKNVLNVLEEATEKDWIPALGVVSALMGTATLFMTGIPSTYFYFLRKLKKSNTSHTSSLPQDESALANFISCGMTKNPWRILKIVNFTNGAIDTVSGSLMVAPGIHSMLKDLFNINTFQNEDIFYFVTLPIALSSMPLTYFFFVINGLENMFEKIKNDREKLASSLSRSTSCVTLHSQNSLSSISIFPPSSPSSRKSTDSLSSQGSSVSPPTQTKNDSPSSTSDDSPTSTDSSQPSPPPFSSVSSVSFKEKERETSG